MKIVFDREEIQKILEAHAAAYFDDGTSAKMNNYWDLPSEVEIVKIEKEKEVQNDEDEKTATTA